VSALSPKAGDGGQPYLSLISGTLTNYSVVVVLAIIWCGWFRVRWVRKWFNDWNRTSRKAK